MRTRKDAFIKLAKSLESSLSLMNSVKIKNFQFLKIKVNLNTKTQ